VYELVDTLGSSQPLISQHLKVLKNAGIITSVRTGRQVQYELVTPDVTKLLDEALKLEKLLANT
ncbi:ArsR/SmtB family transcription factor, partial [Bacteroides thetaiotaomicron]|uniref:ArsR/SmtB family transcription factor n=2 Tax=Bacteria TaxID=2 RepID=UPI001926F5B3